MIQRVGDERFERFIPEEEGVSKASDYWDRAFWGNESILEVVVIYPKCIHVSEAEQEGGVCSYDMEYWVPVYVHNIDKYKIIKDQILVCSQGKFETSGGLPMFLAVFTVFRDVIDCISMYIIVSRTFQDSA